MTSDFEFLGVSTEVSRHQGKVLAGVLSGLALLDADLDVLETIDGRGANQMDEAEEHRGKRIGLVHQVAEFAVEVVVQAVKQEEGGGFIVVLVIEIIVLELGFNLGGDKIDGKAAVFLNHVNHESGVNGVREIRNGIHPSSAEMLPYGVLKGDEVARAGKLSSKSSSTVVVSLLGGSDLDRAKLVGIEASAEDAWIKTRPIGQRQPAGPGREVLFSDLGDITHGGFHRHPRGCTTSRGSRIGGAHAWIAGIVESNVFEIRRMRVR
jgi:hypothetical protein